MMERTPFGQRLFDAREAAELTQDQAAKAVGMSQGTLAEAEISGKRSGYTSQLAELYGVIPTWLATGKGPRKGLINTYLDSVAQPKVTEPHADYIPIKRFAPLISSVRAGTWDEAVDNFLPGEAEDWLPCPKNCSVNTYCLRVKGDSMTSPTGRSYPEGTIVFVDPEKKAPNSGDRIIAKLSGEPEVTFKVFIQESGKTWLKPLNPQYPPIFEEFKVLGTVIGAFID